MKNLLAIFIGLATIAAGASPVMGADDAAALVAEAQTAAEKGDSRVAVALLDRAVVADDKSVEAYYWRGRERFRLGEVEASIDDFDRVAKLQPERERELWERGISHYYAGRFADGAKQFELYQTYHDNDVENSVWRYLCVARKESVEKAKANMLPIKNDRRVPFMEIFALYQGKLKPDDVLAAAKAGEPRQAELNARLFYTHLYLGLWHEAAGHTREAKEHLETAEKHKIGHYMWDVAHVHIMRLKSAEKKAGESK